MRGRGFRDSNFGHGERGCNYLRGHASIAGGTLSLAPWGGTITVLAGTATIDATLAGGGLAKMGTGTLLLDRTLGLAGTTTVAGGNARPHVAPGRSAGHRRRPGDRSRRGLQ